MAFLSSWLRPSPSLRDKSIKAFSARSSATVYTSQRTPRTRTAPISKKPVSSAVFRISSLKTFRSTCRSILAEYSKLKCGMIFLPNNFHTTTGFQRGRGSAPAPDCIAFSFTNIKHTMRRRTTCFLTTGTVKTNLCAICSPSLE